MHEGLSLNLLQRRFALWALGQALPEASALGPHLRKALFGVAVAAVGGVMLALGLGIGLIALHQYLVSEGLDTASSLALIALLSVLLAAAAMWLAKFLLDKAVSVSEPTRLFSGHGDFVSDALNAAIQGFLEGIKSSPEAENKAVSEIEERIKNLSQRIQRANDNAA